MKGLNESEKADKFVRMTRSNAANVKETVVVDSYDHRDDFF